MRSAGCLGLMMVPLIAPAMTIRDYEPARHDRFTGFPSAPVWNDGAAHGSRLYAGVGWWAGGANRQFALVSPLHFLAATHYQPTVGSTVRFLNDEGVVVSRAVAALEVVGGTDLTLATLSAPVFPESGVKHFPYLDLGAEANYLGGVLTVFGATARVGRGVIDHFTNNHEAEQPTRVLRFSYPFDDGDGDDARLQGGDSGSPSFVVVDGTPALAGIHLAISTGESEQFNYDTFIPHYIAGLDGLMEPHGYQMTSHQPLPVDLEMEEAMSPPAPRRGNAGVREFTLGHAGGGVARNVRVSLRFPEGAGPDGISAPGWIVEAPGPGEWTFRRGKLEAGGDAVFTASWAALPAVESLEAEWTARADGCPELTGSSAFPLGPSYAEWAAEVAGPTLLKYAFGEEGPAFELAGGSGLLRFPVREDAAARGLSYEVEFSETLEEWSGEMPEGSSYEDGPGAEAGFLWRTVTFPASSARLFCRVKVELEE